MNPFRMMQFAPLALAAVVLASPFTPHGYAQEAAQPVPSAQQQTTAPESPAVSAIAPAAVPAQPAAAKHGKGKKDEYTGPNTLVELPPTPMLDEEGKQRLDPDGKPMFNQPVRQQRDKRGHPLFDEDGKPVMQTATELGFDENGKKLHVPKEKPPKMTPVAISRGTFSVDGMTAKAALNYDIADLKYIYLFAPGVGIAVVSNEPFPGATEQPRGFDGKTLTVKVGEHVLQLGSDKNLLAKDARPAYVLLDRQFTLPSSAPVVGYGPLRKPPYMWPGAKPNSALAGVDAPPVPVSMLPAQLMKPCPPGQMRQAASKVLPGQPAPDQPCVAIAAASGKAQHTAAVAPASAVAKQDN